MWEPLIEEVRPRGKTPPKDLRRTISAIPWRRQNGAKRRGIPAELGPWRLAAQLFLRWAEQGVWERLPDLVQRRGGRARDGIPRRHHRPCAPESGGGGKGGCDSQGRDEREALGRSRGGYGTKACVIADGRGRAIAFALAPGQAHELPLAPGLLGCLPDVPGWVVGDRGLASDAFRDRVWDMGARPAIPPRRTDPPVACPDWIYANRRLVENLWARLKEWRAVATRYEKTAHSFLGALCMAATMDWLKVAKT